MWIAILLLLAIASFWLFFWPVKPIRHNGKTVSEMPSFLASLMVSHTDGALLFIEHEGSDEFLQFVKYIRGGRETLNFGFPNSPWSRFYFDQLKTLLQESHIDYQIEPTGRSDTQAFLNVHDISSIEQAQTIIELALKAMDLGPHERFSVLISGGVRLRIWRRNAAVYRKYFAPRS